MIISKELTLLVIATVAAVAVVSTYVMGYVPIDREFDLNLEFATVQDEDITYVFASGEIINRGDIEITDMEILWNTSEGLIPDDGKDDPDRNLKNIGSGETRKITLEYKKPDITKSIEFIAKYGDGSESIQSIIIPSE